MPFKDPLKKKEYDYKYIREYVPKIRRNVMNHYSNNDPKCACCGEKEFEFLTMDHINGGGIKHRKQKGVGWGGFYNWLRRNNFPEGFQVLCYNCNCARGKHNNKGICPHKQQEKKNV